MTAPASGPHAPRSEDEQRCDEFGDAIEDDTGLVRRRRERVKQERQRARNRSRLEMKIETSQVPPPRIAAQLNGPPSKHEPDDECPNSCRAGKGSRSRTTPGLPDPRQKRVLHDVGISHEQAPCAPPAWSAQQAAVPIVQPLPELLTNSEECQAFQLHQHWIVGARVPSFVARVCAKRETSEATNLYPLVAAKGFDHTFKDLADQVLRSPTRESQPLREGIDEIGVGHEPNGSLYRKDRRNQGCNRDWRRL